ncbi:phosphocarrier protein HPr domain protein [Enterococcus dispar]|uniref:phosphocarrier protein HPr domain protein n=1 Tax=Enterococcus dispar TaxID=44009 RepID=UPI00189FD50E|nr:phosphocarrier protein HPr domain protein [Enterococcus dispar]
MIASTVMWTIFGGILALAGLMMAKDTKSKIALVIGVILFIVGLVIDILAQANLYLNGTTEELTKYLFWFGRR